MPGVIIEVKKVYSVEKETLIMQAIYDALVKAFNIKPNERTIRLIAHEPHRYLHDPDIERPDLHTHVSIDTFAGRSIESKRILYAEIVGNLENLGIPRDHVEILVREIPRENWGIRGGKAGCDI